MGVSKALSPNDSAGFSQFQAQTQSTHLPIVLGARWQVDRDRVSLHSFRVSFVLALEFSKGRPRLSGAGRRPRIWLCVPCLHLERGQHGDAAGSNRGCALRWAEVMVEFRGHRIRDVEIGGPSPYGRSIQSMTGGMRMAAQLCGFRIG